MNAVNEMSSAHLLSQDSRTCFALINDVSAGALEFCWLSIRSGV